jgi:hypothetical protein
MEELTKSVGDSKKLLSLVSRTDTKDDQKFVTCSPHMNMEEIDNNNPFTIQEKNRYINPAMKNIKKIYPTIKPHQTENNDNRMKTPKYNVRSSFYINKEKLSMKIDPSNLPLSSNDSITESVKMYSQSLNLNSESTVQARKKSSEKQLELASRLQNDLLQTRFFK